jgi:hypothetical protein
MLYKEKSGNPEAKTKLLHHAIRLNWMNLVDFTNIAFDPILILPT